VSKDAELILDASDLNAQLTLQRLMEDIAASKSFAVAMSPFGWKGQFTGEGAAEALKPMMHGC
jgi:RNase adaptor protein for sRNA GlmZ degradation